MEKTNDDYILLPRKYVAQLIKDLVVGNNAMLMFSYLASKKRLEIQMDTDEICKLLDIKRSQLEASRRKGDIKSFTLGGVRFYSAFDVARVAELIHRPRRLGELAKIPAAQPPESRRPQ
jgi:hypothetical protein